MDAATHSTVARPPGFTVEAVGLPVRARWALFGLGGAALLSGTYAALLLLGLPVPALATPVAEAHGPVMVFGFVGTLVALERAVAVRTRWAWLAPACSGLGALLLLSGARLAGDLLLATAAVALLAIYRMLWQRQQTVALLSQAAGAGAWYAAVLLWLAGFTVAATLAWLAAFVVLTIAGERLELAHVGSLRPAATRSFGAILLALVLAATATVVWPGAGFRACGVVLLALVAWLARNDVARRTVRSTGQPRYVAAGLLTGYAWLAVAGLLWTVAGPVVSGPAVAGPRYDATLHAIFLGFTVSMIFAHAPVILPAVLRRPLPYHPVLYAPLALLHLSLVARLAVGDLFGSRTVWRWSGLANGVALLGFAGCVVVLASRARRRGPGRPPGRGDASATEAPGAGPAGSARPPRPPTGRAAWHRRTGLIPLTYLAAIAAVAVLHPFLPEWRWLSIHLLLLGAATNAIILWSPHFTMAILRAPAPPTRRAEAARLAVLNAGILTVLASGAAARGWIGVAGAALVFGVITAHLAVLAIALRRALPARFAMTVHYYLAAAVALLLGIPAGAWMLVVDADNLPRVLLFHAHVNLLGWITLTVLGTLLTFWPTVLRTRMPDGAARLAGTAFVPATTGVALLGIGLAAWWPAVALLGLGLLAAGVLLNLVPVVAAARTRPPASFAAWSMAAGLCWLVVALVVDGWTLATAGGPARAADAFGAVLIPLLGGFVAQVLLGALAYLIPMVMGGGPALARERNALMDRHWPQRLVLANGGLLVVVSPVSAYVRITTSLLVLAALVLFLVPAARILLAHRR